MIPTHYYTGVSGRIRFVSLYQEMDEKTNQPKNKWWTNEPMPVLINTIDISPISEILGKRIYLDFDNIGVRGIGKIFRIYPESRIISMNGRYLGQGKYFKRKDNCHYNHLVAIQWEKFLKITFPVMNDTSYKVLSYWQPIFNLKFF